MGKDGNVERGREPVCGRRAGEECMVRRGSDGQEGSGTKEEGGEMTWELVPQT